MYNMAMVTKIIILYLYTNFKYYRFKHKCNSALAECDHLSLISSATTSNGPCRLLKALRKFLQYFSNCSFFLTILNIATSCPSIALYTGLSRRSTVMMPASHILLANDCRVAPLRNAFKSAQ